MELKNFFAQDANGNVIPAATAYLYLADTVPPTLATGLQNAAGAALPNPFTATAQGQLQVAAPDGDYDLRVTGAGRDFTMRVRFIDADPLLDLVETLKEETIIVERFTGADDTAKWRAAINAASARGGGTVKGTAMSYTLRNLLVTTDNIHLDFNGAHLTANPANPAAPDHSGAPMIYAHGSAGAGRTFAAVAAQAKTIDVAGFGADFAVGDAILLRDDRFLPSWNFGQPGASVGPGISYRAEINKVVGKDGDVLTLELPTMFDYDTGQTVRKLTMLKNFKVMNIAGLTEPDPGGPYTGDFGTMANTPFIIGVEYADHPEVIDVSATSWQLQLVNFKFTRDGRAVRVNGEKPIRPATGGHGYINRADRSLGCYFTECIGHGVRHVVDCVMSRDTVSTKNKGYDSVASSFAAHGHFSRGFTSIDDTDFNGNAGWAIGNGSFAADHESKIINPTAIGSPIAILLACLSEDIEIINPQFRNVRRGIYAVAGVKRCTVSGGRMTPMSTTPALILFRSKQNDGDAFAVPCEDIRVLGGIYETRGGPVGQAPIVIGANGLIEVSDNYFRFDDPCFAGVYITSQDGVALAPTEFIFERNRGWGTAAGRFFSQTLVPSNQFVFRNNVNYGAARNNYIAPLESFRFTMTGNNNGQGGWVFSTPIQDAITAGGTVAFNYPDISGGWFNRLKQLMVDTFSAKGLSAAVLAGANGDITFGSYTDPSLSPQFNSYNPRWIFRKNNAAEGGGNAGSDLQILRRADDGSALGVPISIARATGDIAMVDGRLSQTGTYLRPFVIAGMRIWQNASTTQLRYRHGSDPTSDGDGNPLVRMVGAPASAAAQGTPGDLALVNGYLHACIASGNWQRAALTGGY
jgi:hypothetical protein